MPKQKNIAQKVEASKVSKGKSSLKPKSKMAGSKMDSKALKPLGNKKTAPAAGGVKEKKQFKWRPGTVALREIKRYQKATNMLLPRAPFHRLVRSICSGIDSDIRFQSQALVALQESAEAYLTGVFEDSNLCALHANRVTMMKKDMDIARRIRGDKNFDHRDNVPKTGDEVFYSLPYSSVQEGMKALKQKIGV